MSRPVNVRSALPFGLSARRCALNLLGSAILAFGLYHIHSFAGVTEGGILGATLLLQHWFHISPAWSSLVMNAISYLVGWRVLGRDFILYSIAAGGGFSLVYALCEQFPPLWPDIAAHPLAAALAGALFVGVGIGLCVRAGGAPGGDDALAMALSHLTGWNIRWPYLGMDMVILLLSLSYIPLERMGWSLLTVVLSGQLIGLFQKNPSYS
ncbi:YitT family protein [Mailhella sp.]|uniref:YitT family protein n=1 Tax=Mailhella sp. TaxID=1981029 RepID=UPI0040642B74